MLRAYLQNIIIQTHRHPPARNSAATQREPKTETRQRNSTADIKTDDTTTARRQIQTTDDNDNENGPTTDLASVPNNRVPTRPRSAIIRRFATRFTPTATLSFPPPRCLHQRHAVSPRRYADARPLSGPHLL